MRFLQRAFVGRIGLRSPTVWTPSTACVGSGQEPLGQATLTQGCACRLTPTGLPSGHWFKPEIHNLPSFVSPPDQVGLLTARAFRNLGVLLQIAISPLPILLIAETGLQRLTRFCGMIQARTHHKLDYRPVGKLLDSSSPRPACRS